MREVRKRPEDGTYRTVQVQSHGRYQEGVQVNGYPAAANTGGGGHRGDPQQQHQRINSLLHLLRRRNRPQPHPLRLGSANPRHLLQENSQNRGARLDKAGHSDLRLQGHRDGDQLRNHQGLPLHR